MRPEEIAIGQVYHCASDDCQIVSCRGRVLAVEGSLVCIQEIGSMLELMPAPRWIRYSEVFRPVTPGEPVRYRRGPDRILR